MIFLIICWEYKEIWSAEIDGKEAHEMARQLNDPDNTEVRKRYTRCSGNPFQVIPVYFPYHTQEKSSG